jgi:hypothetical protein
VKADLTFGLKTWHQVKLEKQFLIIGLRVESIEGLRKPRPKSLKA